MNRLQKLRGDLATKLKQAQDLAAKPDASDTDLAAAKSLADECKSLKGQIEAAEAVEAELKALGTFAASAAPKSAIQHGGGTPDAGTPAGRAAKVGSADGSSVITGGLAEAEKFLETGPFKSLGHYAYAIHHAGSQPGSRKTDGALGEWRDGFVKHADAVKALMGFDPEAKATSGMNEYTDSEGGVLVPPQFAAGIWQRSIAQENLLAKIPTIPVMGNNLTVNAYQDKSRADGSRMGGVRGYWTAEAGQFTGSQPRFRQINLKLNKLTVMVFPTDELLDDVSALESQIYTLASNEFTFKLNDAVIRGNGVGMPLGLLNAGCKIAAASNNGANTTISATDIDNMWIRRMAANSGDYIWLANQDTETQLAQLNYSVANTGAVWLFLPAGGIGNLPTPQLKGRPLYFIEQCETLGTEGDLILFNPKAYAAIVKSTGIKQAVSMHLRFDYEETAFRFSFRMDGRPYAEAALTPFKGSNTQSPIVTLETNRAS